MEKRPTLTFFFSESCLTPPTPYLPNKVCFSHTHVFWNLFFFLIYVQQSTKKTHGARLPLDITRSGVWNVFNNSLLK